MARIRHTTGTRFELLLDDVTSEHNTILISLGGMSASRSSERDDIQTLAKRLRRDTIIPIWGEGHVVTRSRVISRNILKYCDRIKDLSDIEPKIILVGKSMGGHKLWRTSNRLAGAGKEIALFVGIDVSGSLDRHHEAFLESGGDDGAKWFEDNVKKLYGFYQTTLGESQTGSPLLYTKSEDNEFETIPPVCDGAYNVQVYKTLFNHQTLKPDLNGKQITDNIVGHRDIDTDPSLINIVEQLVKLELG